MCEYCNTQDCRTCAKAHIEASKYREESCFDASLYLDCENECGMNNVVDCAYQPVSYCCECGQYLGKNEPLTLEELKQMDGEPIWCDVANCEWIPKGGYWCIAKLWCVLLPSGATLEYNDIAVSNYTFYRHKPKGSED